MKDLTFVVLLIGAMGPGRQTSCSCVCVDGCLMSFVACGGALVLIENISILASYRCVDLRIYGYHLLYIFFRCKINICT